MARVFFQPETYGGTPQGYNLLPFRFIALDSAQEVIVNEAGEYLIVPRGTARTIVRRELNVGADLYKTLKAKQFIYDGDSSPLLDLLATKYRTKKSFLNSFTRLHIFVITLRCDHSCHYCQVSRQTADRLAYDMSPETVARSVDLMMNFPGKNLTLEFQGGEPTLALDLIKLAVDRAKNRAANDAKQLNVVVTTNLSQITDDTLYYFRDEQIKVSTSLDGPAFIHNANRLRPGNDSYELTVRGIQRSRDILGPDEVSAIMTTTRLSLDHPIEIIDEYARQDFRSIFLRPISPYGFAVKSKHRTGYEMEKFLEFYKKGLSYILALNKNGVNMIEVYTRILLTKLLTPYPTGYVDLQSPAGAGISVIVYNYDGDLYATDESRMLAEMGDKTFRLGNVHQNSYREIFYGEPFGAILSAACNETLPGCSECAFQLYCGADPVFHHATQGDMFGHRPTSAFCHKNMEVIKHLLRILSQNDKDTVRIFFAWLRDASVQEVREGAPA